MTWLTVSIDLCGSTKVKQALVACSSGDALRRRDLYDEYLKTLYATERRFYTEMLSSSAVEFEKLFLVKAIGDELWYMYEMPDDPDGLASETCAILTSLRELCAQERPLHFETADLANIVDDMASPDGLPAKLFDIPIKVCVDLLLEPIEMTKARYEFLKDVAFLAEGDTSAVYKVDEEFLAYCNRLNLAAPSPFESGSSLTTRKDFIGLEVDRFFRLTAFCLPRMIGIGDTLFSRLPVALTRAQRGHEHLDIKIAEFEDRPDASDEPALRGYLISQPVPSVQMKGISGDYAVHHFFGAESLGESVYCPPAGIDSLMEPTRSFLAEHGFYSLNRGSLLP